MKKFVLVMMIVVALALFVGCGGSDKGGDATPTPTVEATATPEPTDTPEPTATPVPVINVAEGKPVTADHEENGDFTADKAVDGDESTRWSGFSLQLENPMENYDRWLLVDLEEEYNLNGFDVWFEYLSVSFKLEVSLTGEEDSWTTVFDTEGINPVGANQMFEENFDEVKARYVRLSTYLHDEQAPASGHPYCSVYELYVWALDESKGKQG